MNVILEDLKEGIGDKVVPTIFYDTTLSFVLL